MDHRCFGAAAIGMLTACAAPLPPPKVEAASSTLVLPNGEPILRLPIRAGAAVLCQQGNRSPKPASHAYDNCLHALDLGPVTGEALDVLAAAPGTVAAVVTGAAAGDTMPGHGFGNQVRIAHEHGYYTLYAHLSTVSARVGDKVEAGAVIGKMGDTGKAGNMHLHWSLHRGDAADDRIPPTVPMHALITADLDGDGAFGLVTGLELTCAPSRISAEGHVYGSELRPGTTPLLGAPPAPLAASLAAAKAAIARITGKVSSFERIIADRGKVGGRASREALEALVRDEPQRWEAHYWIAVISLELGDVLRAKAALAEITRAAPKEPPWILPWVDVRLAQVAEKEGRAAEAEALYRRAGAHHEQGAELETMVRQGLSRLAGGGRDPVKAEPR